VSAILPAALLVALCGVVAGGLAPWLLRRAPEPELEPDEVKVPYASLATTRVAIGAGLWAAALATVSVLAVEPDRVGPWLVVAVVGALASVVDVATTWIPRRWLHLGWVLTALAVVGSGWSLGDWPSVGRSAIGVAIMGGIYAAVYLVAQLLRRAMFGFADVRLGILAGMVAGWRSIPTATTAIVLGALVGAGWGVVWKLRRRGGTEYAYGPSIVLGPYLALVVSLLTQR
jgi:leader peptidase (prepilin peptidase)/N-methyltransferase